MITTQAQYSSQLSSKSSLLTETKRIMAELGRGYPPNEVRRMVLEDNILKKRTLRTRESIWDTLHKRFISSKDPEVLAALLEVVNSRLPERDRQLVLFYELAKARPLIYDLTVGPLYELYFAGRSSVDKADLLAWLEEAEAAGHEEIAGWSAQTRGKVASNYLTIARDFGLLEGKQRKRFSRMYVPLPAFLYVLYRLKDEELPPKAIVGSTDFRLFLMDDQDISVLLGEAAREGYVDYQRAGDIVDLSFNYGSLSEVVDELTSEVQRVRG